MIRATTHCPRLVRHPRVESPTSALSILSPRTFHTCHRQVLSALAESMAMATATEAASNYQAGRAEVRSKKAASYTARPASMSRKILPKRAGQRQASARHQPKKQYRADGSNRAFNDLSFSSNFTTYPDFYRFYPPFLLPSFPLRYPSEI